MDVLGGRWESHLDLVAVDARLVLGGQLSHGASVVLDGQLNQGATDLLSVPPSHILVHVRRQTREYVAATLRLTPPELAVGDEVTAHGGSDAIAVFSEPEEEQADES